MDVNGIKTAYLLPQSPIQTQRRMRMVFGLALKIEYRYAIHPMRLPTVFGQLGRTIGRGRKDRYRMA